MMNRIYALTYRELAASFWSPVAYITAFVFLIATGYLFMTQTLVPGNEATIRPLFENMAWVLVFAVPMLTMRVMSEEFASGTIEPLMTAPVTDAEVIISKWLGVLLLYVALLSLTLLHVVMLLKYGGGELSVVLFGYLGMLLLGGLYVSVGVLASTMTRHQLVAAILGIAILSLFTIIVDMFAGWTRGDWRERLGYINILYQFKDFSKGILDTKSVIFFLSGTAFFLFLSVKVLESRRWR